MGRKQSISGDAPLALVGVDVGSSAIKACAFTPEGELLGTVRRSIPPSNPACGISERDAELVWSETADALNQLIQDIEARVIALSVTGCGNGAVFVDAELKPILPGVMSTDDRAAALVEADESALQRRYAGQTASLLKWFRENQAERQNDASLAWVLSWKDFIRARLTGLALTDPTDAGAAGLINIVTRNYQSDDPALPPIQDSISVAGFITSEASRLTGLPEGLAVAVGCVDFEAAAIGTGLSDAQTISIVAGSWSINQTYCSDPLPQPGMFLCNPPADSSRSFLVLEGSPNSSNHFEWFWQNFAQGTDIAGLAESGCRAASEGLTFVPGLYGSGAHFVGLRAHHTIADLAGAVMRGVCFAHRRHVDALRSHGLPFRSATLAGGASASPAWTQLFADVLELPVAKSAVTEPGALGAAMIAGVATGVWSHLGEAQQAMVPSSPIFAPAVSRSAQFETFVELSGKLQ